MIDQSEFQSYFRRFGRKISSVRIWSIASQSLGAPELYVKLYKATKVLKCLNHKINDNNLRLFIKRITISVIINLIGEILLFISIGLSLIGAFLLSITSTFSILFNTSIFLLFLLFVLFSQISGYIIEISAWSHLNDFFFSLDKILGAGYIEDGTKKLRKGCGALIISSLLGVTFVIIGLNFLPIIANGVPSFFDLLTSIIGLCVLAGIPYFIGRFLLTKGYFEISNLKNL
jgi:uncharacterized membrane protein